MSFDSSHFMAQLAELRNDRDNADVTLDCQGELIKAHSFFLATRYVALHICERNNLTCLVENIMRSLTVS